MDFTQMPVFQGYKPLKAMIDTFTGWIEGFPTHTERVTQGVSKALGITFYLHFAWRPQSSGKVKSQQILKISGKKDNPGDLPGMEGGLPIALLHTCNAPKEQVGLSPYEMLYGRPFVYISDLFLDPEAQTLQSLPWLLGNSNKYTLVGCQPGPKRF